jgi:hypothetical protein
LKNEANHTLASLAAMAQPALVACRGHGSAAAAQDGLDELPQQ